jgi:hypothetical protein
MQNAPLGIKQGVYPAWDHAGCLNVACGLQVFDLRHADGVKTAVHTDDFACGIGPAV